MTEATKFAETIAAVPQHVAIIMDGNGRWAAARGLPRVEGHRRGVEALRKTVRAAGDMGIRVLTTNERDFRRLAEFQVFDWETTTLG